MNKSKIGIAVWSWKRKKKNGIRWVVGGVCLLTKESHTHALAFVYSFFKKRKKEKKKSFQVLNTSIS